MDLENFVKYTLGKFNIKRGHKKKKKKKEKDTIFSSELIASTYKRIGILA